MAPDVVAITGIAVACVGVAIAVFQLRLAALTLMRIDQQIDLAQREIALVDADLKNNQRMTDEALRRPDIEVRIELRPDNRSPSPNRYFFSQIRNRGSRTSHGQRVEIFVPTANGFSNPDLRETFEGVEFVGRIYTRFTDGAGSLYATSRWETLRPGAGLTAIPVENATAIPMYWRVYDDFGSYPKDGFQRVEVAVPQ